MNENRRIKLFIVVTSFVICSSLICILLWNLINLRWQNNGLEAKSFAEFDCITEWWIKWSVVRSTPTYKWQNLKNPVHGNVDNDAKCEINITFCTQFGNVEWHCMTHLRTNWVSAFDLCFQRLANKFQVVRCIYSSIGIEAVCILHAAVQRHRVSLSA